MKKTITILLFILLMLMLNYGCTSTPKVHVRVDSISSQYELSPSGKKFLLMPAMDVNLNDLQFQEYHAYLVRALVHSGYDALIEKDNFDIAVLFVYGIGDPKTEYFTYSIPIIGQTGGGTSSFSSQTFGSRGSYSTTGYIYSVPTYGIVGAYTGTGSVTTYPRWIVMEAIDYKKFKISQQIVPLWKTTITSVGQSDDLRRVFPVMLGAAQEFIGKDTHGKVDVVLYPDDNRVKRILTPLR